MGSDFCDIMIKKVDKKKERFELFFLNEISKTKFDQFKS